MADVRPTPMFKKALPYFLATCASLATVVLFLPFQRLLSARPATVGFTLLMLTAALALKWNARIAVVATFIGIVAWQFFFLGTDFFVSPADFYADTWVVRVGNVLLVASLAATTMTVAWLAEHVRVSRTIGKVVTGTGVIPELEISCAQTRQLIEVAPDAMMIIDRTGQIHAANTHAERLFCYPRTELEKKSIDELLPERARAENRRLRARYFDNPASEEWQGAADMCIRRGDGNEFPSEVTANSLYTVRGVFATLAFRDISERKQAEKQILYLAQHDALTGLPNRSAFCEYMAHAIAHAQREREELAVLFIDLDGFKEVNDTQGHPIGDRILTMAANRLRDCVREGDYVGRHGGDEFVIGLTGLVDAGGGAMVTAKKILERVREPFLIDGHAFRLSASVGISRYPSDGSNIGSLLHAADSAMYQVKAAGRDGYQLYSRRVTDIAQRKTGIVDALQKALRRGELTLSYQPQIDLKHRCILSAEALIRWHKPDDGFIPSRELIRIAEDVGFIEELNEWILRTAFRQLRRWRTAGFPALRMAVNLSPQQLSDPQVAETISSLLRETVLPADAVDIEVTEQAMASHRGTRLPALNRFAETGARLIVDDFGTGHSSLSYLRRFPIKAVKIDRSFIHGIGRDANDTTFVSTIVTLAQSLNLEVVAEGVETAEQENFLIARDCFLAQGYRYSAAVPAEKFFELLRGNAVFVDDGHAGACAEDTSKITPLPI